MTNAKMTDAERAESILRLAEAIREENVRLREQIQQAEPILRWLVTHFDEGTPVRVATAERAREWLSVNERSWNKGH